MYVSVALHKPIGESHGKEISKVRYLSQIEQVDNATQIEAGEECSSQTGPGRESHLE